MTTAGPVRPSNGTRYEFVRVEGEGAAAEGGASAVYDVRVFRPEGEWGARVQIEPKGASLIAGGEGLDDAARTQLVALAKTLAKHGEDASWPRRVLRWRQPGVR